MRLERLKQNWQELGATDPLWAVATADQYRGGRWVHEQFFATGRDQVEAVLATAATLGFRRRGSALDFGCGVGRLSQALADRFERIVGVDIARSMIDHARHYDQEGRCRFVVNDRPDLSLFSDRSFDLVYSEITLMHMRPEYAMGYVREFLRVCTDEGLVVFQLPEVTTKQRLRQQVPDGIWSVVTRLRTLRGPRMEIYGVDREEVESSVSSSGGQVVWVEAIDRAPAIKAKNFRYFVTPRDRG